jgi:PKD repeat protein
MFDASASYDSDGTINRYIMDFGDETFFSGDRSTHRYSKPGTYGVILTVRDNDYLVDHDFVNITVIENSDIPEIQGIVPNQVKPEDSPPWVLNLSDFEPIPTSNEVEFFWHLTGENTSLYSVVGENGTEDRLIFTPIPDAFGTNLVTLWLRSSENLSVSQPLWINITPVNDPPTISTLPDLILHYDDPYTFNYEPYVNDKETPRQELTLELFDGYEENYVTTDGLFATFNYPQKMVGENIYATVKVSDGKDMAQDVIGIQVTSDYVPKLIKTLPDLWLYEGTTKYNVFDLDEYFTDPDNDAIYFSYGQSHLEISIRPNHTVDISAVSEWTGSELVTFRARDPIGAIAEDSIIVTVLPVNDPPAIAGVPDFYIRYGVDYRFDLTPYINDNDNSTDELKIIVSDPQHIRLDIRNNMVIILNYPGEFLGDTLSVRITVTDGLDSAFQEISVTITEDFPPELITPLPDIVFLEDEPLINAFDLDRYFLDVDGDVLYYTTGNINIKITINPDHSVDFSAPTNWFGTESIYFRATDPTGALQEDIVLITVLPVNDAPILSPIPIQTGNESERWVFDLEPYIFDVDNNISELEITVDSEYVVISGNSLIFLGSRELPKQIELTVSDGEFSVMDTIEIRLNLNERPKTPTLFDLFINILPYILIILIMIFVIAGVVYRKKSRFVAEEVFLIHSGGTLITHLSRNPQANVDDIIFSGMFTAVQEFIKDTFTSDDDIDQDKDIKDSKWALDELKLGDNNILIERSDFTYLAVIFSGEGSKRLRRIVGRLLDKIENKYANILPKWDGNIDELKDTKEILSVLIKPLKVKEEQELEIQPELQPEKDFEAEKSFMKQPESKPKPLAGAISAAAHVVTKPIGLARPVKQPKGTIMESKGLLKSVGEQTGVDRPGLTAWPLTDRRNREFRKNKLPRLPSAIHINPRRRVPKTILIKNDKIMINTEGKAKMAKVAKLAKPVTSSFELENNNDQLTKPISIAMPGKRKEFKIDPNKSLMAQLAEFDDSE